MPREGRLVVAEEAEDPEALGRVRAEPVVEALQAHACVDVLGADHLHVVPEVVLRDDHLRDSDFQLPYDRSGETETEGARSNLSKPRWLPRASGTMNHP